jgi:hypothetical protein
MRDLQQATGNVLHATDNGPLATDHLQFPKNLYPKSRFMASHKISDAGLPRPLDPVPTPEKIR